MKQEIVLFRPNSEMALVAQTLGVTLRVALQTSNIAALLASGPGGIVVCESLKDIESLEPQPLHCSYGCFLLDDSPVEVEPEWPYFDQAGLSSMNTLTRRVKLLLERVRAERQILALQDSAQQIESAHHNNQAVLEHLQSQLRQARDRANQEAGCKTELVNLLAHEIRTPINGIMGMVQWFADSPLDADQQMYLATLQRSGSAMLDMVNDLLDWGKLDHGVATSAGASFDLIALLDEVRLLCSTLAAEKGLQLFVQTDMNLPRWIQADESKLRQVLINLIANGIKYTEQGSISLSLSKADLVNGKDQLKVVISDTGLGIESGQIPRLFEPFWQAEDWGSKYNKGSGLGLAIVQRLVQALDGEIAVTSELGQGSEFTVHLPLVESVALPTHVTLEQPSVPETVEMGRTYLYVLRSHLKDGALDEANSILSRLTKIGNRLRCVELNEAFETLESGLDQVASAGNLAQLDQIQALYQQATNDFKLGAA